MKTYLFLIPAAIILVIFTMFCGCTNPGTVNDSPGDGGLSGPAVLYPVDINKTVLFSGQGELQNFFDREVLMKTGTGSETDFSLAYARIFPGKGTPPHYLLGSSETIYIVSGKAEATVDGIKHEVDEGQAIFIPAGSVQSIRNINSGEDLVYLTSVDPPYNPDVDLLIRGDAANMTYKSHPQIHVSDPQSNERWDPSEGCVVHAVMNPGMLTLTENEILPGYSIAYASIDPRASIPKHRLTESFELDYVLEGDITVIAGDGEFTISEGETIIIPKNIVREFVNNGKKTVKMLSYVDPCWQESTTEYPE